MSCLLHPEYLCVTVPNPAPIGGQTVGLSPTGVEVIHLPTGLKAFCDHERSQMKNRRIACEMIDYGLASLGWEAPNVQTDPTPAPAPRSK